MISITLFFMYPCLSKSSQFNVFDSFFVTVGLLDKLTNFIFCLFAG